jgi:site-specific DNA-methyltransferase (adenine-specific)
MSNVLPFELPEQPTAPTSTPVPSARPAPVILHESPVAVVYHGHAEDVLAMTRTESVDLIVADPPYGAEWKSNRRRESFDQLEGDTPADRDDIAAVLRECVRVVGQHRHLYVFGPTDVLDGLKVSKPVSLIWDKGTLGSGDVTAPWGPQHEPITFLVSKHRHAGEAGKEGVPARLRKGSILAYPRPTGRNVRHPSEKPVPLLRELIESSSRQGETVADYYGGTGSTGVAAVLAGRKTIIVEKVAKYAELAAERVAAAERVLTTMHDL